MFTGIVSHIGRVRAAVPGGVTRFEIEVDWDDAGLAVGCSVACAGACLTVVAHEPGWFAVEATGETLQRTTLGQWSVGRRINLERSLRVGDELGGHLVSGHVDGTAEVAARQAEDDSWRLAFRVNGGLGRFLAPKGSVAVDGVSLTVNEVSSEAPGNTVFGVVVIPHTGAVTTLGELRVGDRVNLEVDLLARYVARLLATAGR